MMPGLDITLAFFGTALILAIAPGPDNIFVLTQSTLYNSKAGIATTLGLMTGLCLQTAAVALGVATLIRTFPWAFNLLKILGAVYLCWLGIMCLKARASTMGNSPSSFIGYWRLYLRGVIMNITNPKVLLFFLAFLPQFCRPDAGPYGWQIIYFGLEFILAAFIVFSLVSLLGGRLSMWFNSSPAKQIALNRITALVFFGLAIWLLFAEI